VSGPLANLVAIPAFDGAEAGMKVLRGEVEAANGDIRRQKGVEAPEQVNRCVSPRGAEGDDLTGGMDSGICTPGADHTDWLLRETLRCPLQLSLNRASLGLNLKAEETGAIVLDDSAVGSAWGNGAGQRQYTCRPYSTSSIMAMSALSPLRWPILKMRV